MNVPEVCDTILECIADAKPDSATLYDGGFITPKPTDEAIEFLGTEDGDEEWESLGKSGQRRTYSLGLQVMVAREGLDSANTKYVRDRAFEIYESLREALLDLDFITLVPSAERNLDVKFEDYRPAYNTKSRIAYVAGLIRVAERD